MLYYRFFVLYQQLTAHGSTRIQSRQGGMYFRLMGGLRRHPKAIDGVDGPKLWIEHLNVHHVAFAPVVVSER